MTDKISRTCFHCSLPIPDQSSFTSVINGQPQGFCCPGCQAVAESIVASGLDQFYEYRSIASRRVDPSELAQNFKAYDLPQLQAEFVQPLPNPEQVEAQFVVEGITCAACVWLIEHQLQATNGIVKARVNAATGRLFVTWVASQLKLSQLMATVSGIGYGLVPANENQRLSDNTAENRLALMRLGVAGLGMMQVGMVAIAIYAGADEQWLNYFRWVSLLIATPVVLFSARPFFSAAWQALRHRHLIMDVPVALAIGFAYLASVWATLSNTGEVYFDSVSMFTFFLLLGRYMEMRTRHDNNNALTQLAQLLPVVVTRLVRADDLGSREIISIKALAVGDCVVVAPGEVIPCDGTITDGTTRVDEAMITGESEPVAKQLGANVVAGTTNVVSPIVVRATAVGTSTELSAIERMVDRALAEKPRPVAIADRVSGYFVAAVLIISAGTFVYWYHREPEHALWVVLSVLVVTCPCALSLATPTAYTAGLSRLRRAGLLLVNSSALVNLRNVDQVVFDKTGTLTEGKPTVAQVHLLGSVSEEECLGIIAALEQDNHHPIATAFTRFHIAKGVSNRQTHASAGVSGEVDGRSYAFGRADFVARFLALEVPASVADQHLLLADEQGLLAGILLRDALRADASAAVEQIKSLGAQVTLLSGDNKMNVAAVAEQLEIDSVYAQALPADKLAMVRSQQARGQQLLMVGDGINDVPVLSGADISVAMGSACDLAQTSADAVLLSGDLTVLPKAIRFSNKVASVVRQNLSWALGYNLLALPLAVAGFIPPWAAAIGMSLSSLIVVANAVRLSRAQLVH